MSTRNEIHGEMIFQGKRERITNACYKKPSYENLPPTDSGKSNASGKSHMQKRIPGKISIRM